MTADVCPDRSKTLFVAQRDNWLPAPKGGDFTLYVRAYRPKAAVIAGSWNPPAVQRVS